MPLSALYRLLFRHRLYTALNIAGMALGIATCLSLGLTARYELSWDRFYPHANEIWRLSPVDTEGNDFAQMLPGTVADLRQRLPATPIAESDEGEEGVHASSGIETAYGETESIERVNPGFPHFFALPFAEGDRDTALNEPDRIVLSADMARHYFPHMDAMGRSVTLTDRGGKKTVYRVTGVLKPTPMNTSIASNFLIRASAPKSLAGNGGSIAFGDRTYVRARSAAERNAILNAAGAAFVSGFGGDHDDDYFVQHIHFSLKPLTSLHFGEDGEAGDGASRSIVISLAVIGVLALLMACVNYINLATAQAMSRARETAIRKALGATRAALVRRMLGESVFLAAIAAIPGLALTELCVPTIASLSGWAIPMDYGWSLPVLVCIVLVLGLGAGAYPAFVLAGFPIAPVLASAKLPAQGRLGTRLRTLLVGVQFAFTVSLGICTLVVNAQGLHLRHADRGLDPNDLLTLSTNIDGSIDKHQTAILETLRRMPQIASATLSDGGPMGPQVWGSITGIDRSSAHLQVLAQGIDTDFASTLGLRLLAGRPLDPTRSEDTPPSDEFMARNLIISAALLPALGLHDPRAAIGQTIHDIGTRNDPHTIIGVVNEVHYDSGRNAPTGTLYSLRPRTLAHGAYILLRARPGQSDAVLAGLRAQWPKLAPGSAFHARRMTEVFAETTRQDTARGKLFLLGSVAAIGIACLGLYGLAAFNAARRTHEIGIRKTLGATTGQVLRLLLAEFLRPVLLASVIAWAIAYAIMRGWLQGFSERIALSPLYFIAMTGLAALLCTLTILGRTARLARTAPAEAMRQG